VRAEASSALCVLGVRRYTCVRAVRRACALGVLGEASSALMRACRGVLSSTPHPYTRKNDMPSNTCTRTHTQHAQDGKVAAEASATAVGVGGVSQKQRQRQWLYDPTLIKP